MLRNKHYICDAGAYKNAKTGLKLKRYFMNRLDFLKRLGLIAGGAVAVGAGLGGVSFGLSGCSEQTRKRKIIGLQLYSIRDAMAEDVKSALAKVAEIGYANLETASYSDGNLYGMPAAEFRKMAEDAGLKITGAHLGSGYSQQTEADRLEWWKKAMDTHAAIDCENVVIPSVGFSDETTLDDVKAVAEYFNKVGDMASQRGLRLSYHNHARELESRDGQVILDYLIDNTDASLVSYELDVYWATVGGANPAEYIEKYSGRFPLLHIKDESIIGESGKIDFEPIFKAAYRNGMEEFYVEVEKNTLPPEICVERSFDFLDVADYVK